MIDIDHLRQWIGREEVQSELLTPSITERFNATFNLQGDTENGAIAPALIHLCLAPPAIPTEELGPDGHPARGGFLPPVPLPRRMWAGGAFSLHDDIHVGEMVTRRSIIQDVVVKEGRTGLLCFVTVEHQVDSNGRAVLTERQDIVYRGDDSPESTAKNAPSTAPESEYRFAVQPSAAMLFRYSALTFNGHRIHYDVPYVRYNEGYPGLVVHGPMQATMLMQMAERVRGLRPLQFEFRSLSPLFDDAEFILNAAEDGTGLKLWTSYAGGPVATMAWAEW